MYIPGLLSFEGPMLAVVTIFLGSFLLFGVQPLVGRTLLPAFGGTSSEWVACLCAFQTLLLLGYLQAHRASASPRRRRVHAVLLLVSAAWAFFAYTGWKSFGASLVGGPLPPGVQVLLCVLALCGLPYVLLSANSSLVQACVAESGAGRGAYRLYGVSNAGSLAGLLAYPFLFEPYVTLSAQWRAFGVGIALYALLLASLMRRRPGSAGILPADAAPGSTGILPADGQTGGASTPCEPPLQSGAKRQKSIIYYLLSIIYYLLREKRMALLALLLPALSCFLLNAVTAHMTLDVMPMPMLWAILLAVFLASYIVGFTAWAERNVRFLAILALAPLCAACWINGKTSRDIPMKTAVLVLCAFLACGCTFLHAWLYAIRPDAGRLTRYYLLNSIGGAIGGILASLVAPLVFSGITEYPIALALVGAAAVAAATTRRMQNAESGMQNFPGAERQKSPIFYLLSPISYLLLVCAAVLYVKGAGKETRPVVYRGRGFFGTIQVLEAKARASTGEGCIREFVHGTTIHGIQAHLPGKTRMPTTYYTPDASGYAIAAHPKYRRGEPMRVNITGLGIGVMFCYGRTNDYYRAYEISPDALAVATDTNLFTFVADCPAKKEIVLGDARQGLEDELRRGVEPYDVIVVDAFTGDNLPYHLSTKEAFDLYFKLLKPDGVLCVNISNWHLQLEPFMRALGEAYDVPLLGLETLDDYGRLAFGAKVAFFCRKPEGLAMPPVGPKCRIIDFNAFKPMPHLPTDEKGSFLDLVR